MKKFFALFTSFLGGSLLLFFLSLIGCDKKDRPFLFKDIRTDIIQYQSNGLESPLSKGDTANYSNFFLASAFDIKLLSSAKLIFQGSKTYAFQPGDRHYKPVEKISNISITTLNNYNSNYPAGTDITAACRFRITGTYVDAKDSSASVAIEHLNAGFSDIDSDLQSAMQIYLNERPGQLSPQQFAIELRTEVNATIRDTTIHFYLKP